MSIQLMSSANGRFKLHFGKVRAHNVQELTLRKIYNGALQHPTF
jgi:hypothetical protein